MRIQTFPKISREAFDEAPDWFEPMYETVNPFIETVNIALQGSITLGDNIKSESIYRKWKHGEEVFYQFARMRTRAEGIIQGFSDVGIRAMKMTPVGNQGVRVTLWFVDDPTEQITAKVHILGS